MRRQHVRSFERTRRCCCWRASGPSDGKFSPMGRERVLVALSGGVDSSVVAGLLLEEGHDVIGVTMHLLDEEPTQRIGRCCSSEDREDARRVCDALSIPHYVIDEREAFADRVINPFVESYLAGETPSPCISCNQHVKLNRFVALARTFGASFVATGHYARIDNAAGQGRIYRGLDRTKDQSYFLFGLPLSLRRQLIFPLGGMTKEKVREEARRLRLPNADKPDSQSLCFLPDGRVGDFVERRTTAGAAAGRFVSEAGEVLGEHRGVHHFTVGQRKGLGLASAETPKYVLKIVPGSADVVVGDAESLYSSQVRAVGDAWLQSKRREPFRAEVRIRYRHEPAAGWVEPNGEGFAVNFDEQQRAVAPGQAAVVYEDEEVLGGGYICA